MRAKKAPHKAKRRPSKPAAAPAYPASTLSMATHNLINMVIPQATLEGWEPRPTPSDWTEGPPGAMQMSPSKPIVNRFERPMVASSSPEGTAPVTIPPRNIGSKIPINRRHKRKR